MAVDGIGAVGPGQVPAAIRPSPADLTLADAKALAATLNAGEILSARVGADLGNGQVALTVRGQILVASSPTPLAQDSVVKLQVQSVGEQPVLRLLAATLGDAAQTSTASARAATLGLPATATALLALQAFEQAGAPLDAQRLQAAVEHLQALPGAQVPQRAAALAALAQSGLPATPPFIALAERSAAGTLPRPAAAVLALQAALRSDAGSASPPAQPALARAPAQPAPASGQPPATSGQPPATSGQPPATSPATSQPAAAGGPPLPGVAPPAAPAASAVAIAPASIFEDHPLLAALLPPHVSTQPPLPIDLPGVIGSLPIDDEPAAPSGTLPPVTDPDAPEPATVPVTAPATTPAAGARAPVPTAASTPTVPPPATPVASAPTVNAPAPTVPATSPQLTTVVAPWVPVAQPPVVIPGVTTLTGMPLPDLARGGAGAVLQALGLAGVRPRETGELHATRSEPLLHRLASPIAEVGAVNATADSTTRPPLHPFIEAAIAQVMREQAAETVVKPHSLVDYDLVMGLPLQVNGQPLPARLAVAERQTSGGTATFLRVDTELSNLGPLSVRISGMEGGPLAITVLASGAALGELAAAMPDLNESLRALGLSVGLRLADLSEDLNHG